MTIKQVIVIRKDLKMRRGKEIAQGSHASMAFLTNRLRKLLDKNAVNIQKEFTKAEWEWMEGGFTKICLSVDSEQELLEIFRKSKELKLETQLITDSGKTEFNGIPTNTCLCIGPDYSEKIDPVTSHLKLY